MRLDTIINRDALCALRELPAESVHCCVTSPPYYALRDYGMDAQIGREDTPEQYIARLVEVFRELKRVLRPDGTFWLNIADTYCGTGSKGACTDPKNPKGRNGQSLSLARRAAGSSTTPSPAPCRRSAFSSTTRYIPLKRTTPAWRERTRARN